MPGERKNMKRYFLEYESDRKVCGDHSHIYGFASTLKTAKSYINRCKKEDIEYNPRNFRIYDTCGECRENAHVPCVYHEE